MRVMEGQSFERPTDGKWIKLELSLDETDLIKLLAEWGADNPADLSCLIRTSQVYDILSVHAQILIALRAHAEGVTTLEAVTLVVQRLNARVAKQKIAVGLAKE